MVGRGDGQGRDVRGDGPLAPVDASAATPSGAITADSITAGIATGDPVLVFDGGCLFCSHFAHRSVSSGGLPGLRLRDGRADPGLRQELRRRGLDLNRGAVLIDGDRALHGAAAIQELCRRLRPREAPLRLLAALLADPGRARVLYPLLLLARRLALAARGLPLDPDR
jgi:predicted DCC family thiol-disulfide oxidoreductase YuxK